MDALAADEEVCFIKDLNSQVKLGLLVPKPVPLMVVVLEVLLLEEPLMPFAMGEYVYELYDER